MTTFQADQISNPKLPNPWAIFNSPSVDTVNNTSHLKTIGRQDFKRIELVPNKIERERERDGGRREVDKNAQHYMRRGRTFKVLSKKRV